MSICLDGDDWQLRGCLGSSGTGTRDRRRDISPDQQLAPIEQAQGTELRQPVGPLADAAIAQFPGLVQAGIHPAAGEPLISSWPSRSWISSRAARPGLSVIGSIGTPLSVRQPPGFAARGK